MLPPHPAEGISILMAQPALGFRIGSAADKSGNLQRGSVRTHGRKVDPERLVTDLQCTGIRSHAVVVEAVVDSKMRLVEDSGADGPGMRNTPILGVHVLLEGDVRRHCHTEWYGHARIIPQPSEGKDLLAGRVQVHLGKVLVHLSRSALDSRERPPVGLIGQWR